MNEDNMYSKEIYLLKNGSFGYKILKDEYAFIVQEIKPSVEGNVEMSESEANIYAEKELQYFLQVEEEENKNGV